MEKGGDGRMAGKGTIGPAKSKTNKQSQKERKEIKRNKIKRIKMNKLKR